MCENESIVSKREPMPETDHFNQGKSCIFEPKTPLGKRLWAIRKKIVASGEPLLGWDEIEKEVAARRGEAD
jgi:hypothetical protein